MEDKITTRQDQAGTPIDILVWQARRNVGRNHAELQVMPIKELAREDAELVAHPLFTEPDEAFTREVLAQRDYALGNLGLSEQRQWIWLARNWRRWAGRLAGMIAIAASATTVIALIWMVLCR